MLKSERDKVGQASERKHPAGRVLGGCMKLTSDRSKSKLTDSLEDPPGKQNFDFNLGVCTVDKLS